MYFSKLGYKIISKINESNYNIVYLTKKDTKFYILKVEKKNLKISLLNNEYKIYNYLKYNNFVNIPKYKYIITEDYNMLITEYVGITLKKRYYKNITKNEAKMLFCNILNKLLELHSLGIIHRDIKPDNIIIDNDDNIYFIDYGISRIIYNDDIQFKDKILGTTNFMSKNAHYADPGLLTYKDDIESLCYTIDYLYHGSLPWCNLSKREYNNKQEYYNKVLQFKCSYKSELFDKIFDFLCFLSVTNITKENKEDIYKEFIKIIITS